MTIRATLPYNAPKEMIELSTWKNPYESITEIEDAIFGLRQNLAQWEKRYDGRDGVVAVTFCDGVNTRTDEHQLQAEGTFYGDVENRYEGSGEFRRYYLQPVMFVCHNRTPLTQQPLTGQTWFCEVAFQIGLDRRKRPIIVVKPQKRIMNFAGNTRAEIARLQQELERMKEEAKNWVEAPIGESGQATTALAAALQKSGIA